MHAVLHARFASTGPQDFCSGSLRLVCFEPIVAPRGFEDEWSVFQDHSDPQNLAWLAPDTLASTTVIVMFPNILDQEQLAQARRLLRYVGSQQEFAPPMFCAPSVPHRDAGAENRPEVLQISSELLELGLDNIICGQLCPFGLALAIRARLREAERQVTRVNTELTGRRTKAECLQELKDSVHYKLWDYMQQRVGTAIPPVDYDLVESENGVAGWTFIAHLGRGMFGNVYECAPPCGVTAAPGGEVMKVYDKAHTKTFHDLKSMNRKIEIMQMLSCEQWRHPNIVQLFAIHHAYTKLYFRMENGGPENLYQRLSDRSRSGPNNRPLPAPMLHQITLQLWSALAHMHTGPRICHRDIKPENVIVHQSGSDSISIKLADFDVAMVQKPGGSCFSPCGTFPFMATEVILSQQYDGFAADMWSMGLVLLELTCGMRILERVLNLRRPRGVAHGAAPETELVRKIEAAFHDRELPRRILSEHGVPEVSDVKSLYTEVISGVLQIDAAARWDSKSTNEMVQQRLGNRADVDR